MKRNNKFIILIVIVILSIGMIKIYNNKDNNSNTKILKENNNIIKEESIAFYIEQDGDYHFTSIAPTSGYILSTTESKCTLNDVDQNIDITYDLETQAISLNPLPDKGSKCKLYFDELPTASEKILTDNANKLSVGSTSIAATATTDEGLKYLDDGMYGGITYYYRGAVSNNWVKFAGIYWRIIRINGDGTIRMIYSGTTAPTSSTATVMTGTGTQIETSAFNSNSDDNMYVGFYYTSNQVHGRGTISTIAEKLDIWYSNKLNTYASDLADGKFCNDRIPTQGTGTGKTYTLYSPNDRVYNSKEGTTNCENRNDIFITKVGLITVDEMGFAGASTSGDNKKFYLYTNQNYWTMSPRGCTNYPNAWEFYLDTNGKFNYTGVSTLYGVRPVINLKNTVSFTGSGTYDDVYKVVGTSD